MAAAASAPTRERIEAALRRVAMLVEDDPAFIPVFERLEVILAEAGQDEPARRRAAALLQNATGARSEATCSSDAPAP